MSVDNIWKSDARYQQYPTFPKYYKDSKEHVEAEKKETHLDDIAAERHTKNHPQSHLNKRGYPHWHTHPVKECLGVDLINNLHKSTRPSQLRKTRSEYKQFSKGCFHQMCE